MIRKKSKVRGEDVTPNLTCGVDLGLEVASEPAHNCEPLKCLHPLKSVTAFTCVSSCFSEGADGFVVDNLCNGLLTLTMNFIYQSLSLAERKRRIINSSDPFCFSFSTVMLSPHSLKADA